MQKVIHWNWYLHNIKEGNPTNAINGGENVSIRSVWGSTGEVTKIL